MFRLPLFSTQIPVLTSFFPAVHGHHLTAHARTPVLADSSQTGLAVEALQDQLPNARVLYSSATGASEPDNLRYMVRLGFPAVSEPLGSLV